jgi:hypothetical protein
MLERPPGADNTRLVGLSVMKFPQFWLAPLANTFADTRLDMSRATGRVAGSSRATGAGLGATPLVRLTGATALVREGGATLETGAAVIRAGGATLETGAAVERGAARDSASANPPNKSRELRPPGAAWT